MAQNISLPERIKKVVDLIAAHEERTRGAVIERALRCYVLQNPTLVPVCVENGLTLEQEEVAQ